jgi:hypothetical protein
MEGGGGKNQAVRLPRQDGSTIVVSALSTNHQSPLPTPLNHLTHLILRCNF